MATPVSRGCDLSFVVFHQRSRTQRDLSRIHFGRSLSTVEVIEEPVLTYSG